MNTSIRRLWPCAFLLVVFLGVYGLTAGISLRRQSLAPHFVYLAQSFLEGRLDLANVPDPPYDLTPFDGRWYVSFPPLPALLMIPLVALRGLAVSDIAFSVVIGALDIPLFYTVLDRLGIRSSGVRVGLCILLGLGTPLWYCAAFGSIWFTAHVVAVTCLCLYLLEVLGKNRPVLAGVWLGLGFLSRAPVLLAFPLALVVYGQSVGHRVEEQAAGLDAPRAVLSARGELGDRMRRERPGSSSVGRQRPRVHCLLRFALLLTLGMAPALLGQAVYNWARFGSPLEFGYRWMNSPGSLMERQATWGQFSIHFLPENLYTLLIRPPCLTLAPLRLEPDAWGMGLLMSSPALLLALPLGALTRDRRRTSTEAQPGQPETAPAAGQVSFGAGAYHRSLRLGLWLSVALVQVPSLLYFNTGSYQFGYRFALDWLPMGVLLLALETGGKLQGWAKALIVASVLMHLWGVLWMYSNFNGHPWHVQYIPFLR